MSDDLPMPSPDADADSGTSGARKRAPRPKGNPFTRLLGAYFHEGAFGYLGFLCIGLALDLLALPPGPLPFLILIADVPFLVILFFQDGKRWKRWAWMYGMLHFGFALRWLGEIHPVQVVGAAMVLGPVYLLLGAAIRWAVRARAPFVLAVGTAVVAEEFVRTFWMGGMPWPSRSLSFASGIPFDLGLSWLLPAASWFGAYAFSFLAGMTSAVVYTGLRLPDQLPEEGSRRRLLLAALQPVGVLLVLLGLAASGHAYLQSGQSEKPETEAALVAIQADIPQSLKHGKEGDTKEMFDRHLSLSATAVRTLGAKKVLAILWPETMVPYPFLGSALAHRFPDFWEGQVGVLRRLKDDVPEAQHLPWLLGVIHKFERPGQSHWNLWVDEAYGTHDSLFLLDPSKGPDMDEPMPMPPPAGESPPWEIARHDKTKLVPGGEYTPLGEVIPPLRWFRNFVSVIPELDPGAEDQAPFEIQDGDRTIKMGTIICFEIAFPARCRAWRRSGAQVLLNAANYGWFGETGFRWQVAGLARLRAAELGVTVVMAGNTGPTAFYGPRGETYGRFRDPAEPEDRAAGPIETTHRRGYAYAPLRVDREGMTLYTQWGDWPWLLPVLVVLLAGILRRNKRSQIEGASG
ncbi:MAG: apolipoprotein N-acyltransferase [Planctomycetota bacterium]|nr:apolipoprotein N-acyltransferase [Planctomycetota bacterium]